MERRPLVVLLSLLDSSVEEEEEELQHQQKAHKKQPRCVRAVACVSQDGLVVVVCVRAQTHSCVELSMLRQPNPRHACTLVPHLLVHLLTTPLKVTDADIVTTNMRAQSAADISDAGVAHGVARTLWEKNSRSHVPRVLKVMVCLATLWGCPWGRPWCLHVHVDGCGRIFCPGGHNNVVLAVLVFPGQANPGGGGGAAAVRSVALLPMWTGLCECVRARRRCSAFGFHL